MVLAVTGTRRLYPRQLPRLGSAGVSCRLAHRGMGTRLVSDSKLARTATRRLLQGWQHGAQISMASRAEKAAIPKPI